MRTPGLAGAAFVPRTGQTLRYRLRQSFTYEYQTPVRSLVHRLVVVPPRVHGDQRLQKGSVTVSEASADVRWHDDAFGNRHCVIQIAEVPSRLEMVVSVVVDRRDIGLALASPRRHDPHARALALSAPSALTTPDDALTRLAWRHAVTGDAEATADVFCSVVSQLVSYGFDATDVDTTAAQALAVGAGVCQDQAHVMLALCRAVGLSARYVSGHLVGQGGTHAWTEVDLPQGVVAYDPCHGRRADERYVTVAVGRDYRDVAPTSGSYVGAACGRLTTSRQLEAEPVAA
ncbi:MAG: transglutaminase family protein [Mycobacteriales bacterium]